MSAAAGGAGRPEPEPEAAHRITAGPHQGGQQAPMALNPRATTLARVLGLRWPLQLVLARGRGGCWAGVPACWKPAQPRALRVEGAGHPGEAISLPWAFPKGQSGTSRHAQTHRHTDTHHTRTHRHHPHSDRHPRPALSPVLGDSSGSLPLTRQEPWVGHRHLHGRRGHRTPTSREAARPTLVRMAQARPWAERSGSGEGP